MLQIADESKKHLFVHFQSVGASSEEYFLVVLSVYLFLQWQMKSVFNVSALLISQYALNRQRRCTEGQLLRDSRLSSALTPSVYPQAG